MTGAEKMVGYMSKAMPAARTKIMARASTHNCHSRRSRFPALISSKIFISFFSLFAVSKRKQARRNSSVEHFPDLARQRVRREWFLKEGGARVEDAVVDNGVVRVAGHVKDPDLRAPGHDAA